LFQPIVYAKVFDMDDIMEFYLSRCMQLMPVTLHCR